MCLAADEHTCLLPLEITLITLIYSSFELIWAPAIIINPFWPLLWHCNCLSKTKNYQSMFNRHFAITTRIASRNHFDYKLVLYWHSLGFLEALDFSCSIFPQVLPVSPRWKQLSLMTKASQGQSPKLLWQSTAFKLSYSKVLRAIVAPSFLGLFFHTINWNSQEIMEITLSQHIYFPSIHNACDQVPLSCFSCILGKIFMFKCFFYVFPFQYLLSYSVQYVSPFSNLFPTHLSNNSF